VNLMKKFSNLLSPAGFLVLVFLFSVPLFAQQEPQQQPQPAQEAPQVHEAQQAKEPPATPVYPTPKVRTVTAFINIERDRYQIQLAEAIKLLHYARTVFESRGYTVQTLRVATQPFPEYTKGLSREETIRFFKNLDGIAEQEHLMLAIGPAYLSGDDGDAQADLLAEVIRATKHIFGTVDVTNASGVNWSAVNAAARVIKNLSENTPGSEGNFRFSAIAEVPPYVPFFPAAYHTGSGHQFAIGLESANTVAAAFQNAPDYPTAKRRLIDAIVQQSFDVEALALRVDSEQGWTYMGLDLSPAPGKDASIGAAIETLSKQPFGSEGTLSAVMVITSALKEVAARRTGYSGLMLPVLEDQRIADRWSAGLVSIHSLLSYSSVCGTGLDTVPLPGDTSTESLSKIIGDVASLAVKWNKPLAARLLPVRGKSAGDRTEFTDPNLINGIIQPITLGQLQKN
jgi:uncharacterized protein (UPF0210 family)